MELHLQKILSERRKYRRNYVRECGVILSDEMCRMMMMILQGGSELDQIIFVVMKIKGERGATQGFLRGHIY